MTRPVLQLEQVTGGYPGHQVLRGITLTLHHGEIVVVTGRNGAGKTTLMHTVAGHLRVAGGRILLHGGDITHRPTHDRARMRIAVVPQGKRLFASLTVAEHLALTGAPADVREQTLDLLPDLRAKLRARPGQLSGGQQQMLAIARALAMRPTILLLDEPGEGLAPHVAAALVDVVTVLADRGGTVLITDPAPAWPATTVYGLDRGHLNPISGPTASDPNLREANR